MDVTTVRKNTDEDAAIDEDEEVAKLTTEVELRVDEDRVVPELITELEFKVDVELGLKFCSAA